MSEGSIGYEVSDGVAAVLFNRPEARNAMTWAMYDGLARACDAIATDPLVRVAVFRGAGGEAFVAGTDIQQFAAFKDGEDGIAYEQRIDAAISQIESLAKPTIAVIEGWVLGGGMMVACSCDFRIATPTARFGVPVARTLGNCLSIANMARLMAHFGPARTKRMMLLAEAIGAEEALSCGFVDTLVARAELENVIGGYCDKLKAHAPLTMRAAKEAIRRVTLAALPDADDLIRSCYGSSDFQEGQKAFVSKRKPEWRGR